MIPFSASSTLSGGVRRMRLSILVTAVACAAAAGCAGGGGGGGAGGAAAGAPSATSTSTSTSTSGGGPLLVSATLDDRDGNGVAGQADVIALGFDEDVDASTLSLAALRVLSASDSL